MNRSKKLLVFSDSHGSTADMVRIVRSEKPDLVLHLGDHASDGLEVEKETGVKVKCVKGNCDLYGNEPEALFRETLEEMLEEKIGGTPDAVLYKIASMSCKAAVKGNMAMSREEHMALIDELLSLDNPYHCPHGRPTMITLTQKEIERKFKRIV